MWALRFVLLQRFLQLSNLEMASSSKLDQLDQQKAMLQKKIEEIRQKSSTTVKVESEASAYIKPSIDIPNDGNFLANFKKMENKVNKPQRPGELKRVGGLNKSGQGIKKSRFSSMFQQMKQESSKHSKTQQNSSTKASFPSCFHGESSDSDEEREEKPSKPATKRTSTGSTGSDSSSNHSALMRAKLQQSAINAAISAQSNKTKTPLVKQSDSSQSKTSSSEDASSSQKRKRKNRWGEKVDLSDIAPPGFAQIPGMSNPAVAPAAASSNQTSLGLPQNYRPAGLVGVTELSDAQKKQLQEQRDMQNMYNLIMASRNASAGGSTQSTAAIRQQQPKKQVKKNKHAYDSDEEIDEEEGTWEHQARRLEMEKTQALAEKLTGEGRNKHFIGDFLPPEELEKFMETYQALKEGRTPDYSDYKEFKIQCDNIGFKMLAKMGWEEGKGLGSEQQGITAPVNKGKQSLDGAGVGVGRVDNLTKDDDDFSAYRKRMMLAYRFRPNPLNNPRRPYY